ncbi:hypothetical protein [Micromonospora sp. CA-246542]|uniref:hypothetical protein n=1 Tax=Micromonospora sp. CA-246542 TaxID=3239959 RepID=UPI003D8DD467
MSTPVTADRSCWTRPPRACCSGRPAPPTRSPTSRHEALLLVNVGHPGPHAWGDRLPRLDTDEVVRAL